MPLVVFTSAALARRCVVTGRDPASVEPSVVSRGGGKVTLDDTHPAYPALRGLGDVIATVTAAVGVKSCSGCKERQKWLNDKVPL